MPRFPIPRLPNSPPNYWFKSAILEKVIVVVCGPFIAIPPRPPSIDIMFWNGGLELLLLELLVFCVLLLVKVLEFEVLFWGLFIFEVLFVLYAVLGMLAVYDCCWAVLAIKWTVIPDYLTKIKILITILSDFVFINKLLSAKNNSLSFQGNINFF